MEFTHNLLNLITLASAILVLINFALIGCFCGFGHTIRRLWQEGLPTVFAKWCYLIFLLSILGNCLIDLLGGA